MWLWELDHKEGWALTNWCFQIVVLEKTLESPLDFKEIKPVNPTGNQSWTFIGRTNAQAEALILWPPDVTSWLRKDPGARKDWRQKGKGMAEDKMVTPTLPAFRLVLRNPLVRSWAPLLQRDRPRGPWPFLWQYSLFRSSSKSLNSHLIVPFLLSCQSASPVYSLKILPETLLSLEQQIVWCQMNTRGKMTPFFKNVAKGIVGNSTTA